PYQECHLPVRWRTTGVGRCGLDCEDLGAGPWQGAAGPHRSHEAADRSATTPPVNGGMAERARRGNPHRRALSRIEHVVSTSSPFVSSPSPRKPAPEEKKRPCVCPIRPGMAMSSAGEQLGTAAKRHKPVNVRNCPAPHSLQESTSKPR